MRILLILFLLAVSGCHPAPTKGTRLHVEVVETWKLPASQIPNPLVEGAQPLEPVIDETTGEPIAVYQRVTTVDADGPQSQSTPTTVDFSGKKLAINSGTSHHDKPDTALAMLAPLVWVGGGALIVGLVLIALGFKFIFLRQILMGVGGAISLGGTLLIITPYFLQEFAQYIFFGTAATVLVAIMVGGVMWLTRHARDYTTLKQTAAGVQEYRRNHPDQKQAINQELAVAQDAKTKLHIERIKRESAIPPVT